MMFDQISPARLAKMQTAVELDVDKNDFLFESSVEASAWDELVVEFEAMVGRLGRLWVAEQGDQVAA